MYTYLKRKISYQSVNKPISQSIIPSRTKLYAIKTTAVFFIIKPNHNTDIKP